MLADAGNFFLSVSLIIIFYAFLISIIGQVKNVQVLKKTSLISLHIASLMVVFSSLCLIAGFLLDDFRMEYVFSYSWSGQALLYKIAGFYAGRAGSLLMWALILTVFSSMYVFKLQKNKDEDLYPVISILAGLVLFFAAMLVFENNPFKSFDFKPAQGQGMNPLLENIYMIVHPPALYLGFILFSIPFAQALVSLYKNRHDGLWIEKTRYWIISAWFFLGLGNVLGSYWAYIELGWGGYWGWDPVENASLIPWLVSTALIHSIIVEKKTAMFRIWNYFLIFVTFILTIVATFLTRSGIVESVHAFAKSKVGNYFLGFIILLCIVSFGLILAKFRTVKRDKFIEFFSSKEAFFAGFNIIMVFSGIAVLLGTLMPAISEMLVSKKLTLEPSYYNRVFSFIGILLLFGLGFCPLVKWRKRFKEILSFEVVSYVVIIAACSIIIIVTGENSVRMVLSYSMSAGALFTTFYIIIKRIKNFPEKKSGAFAYILSVLTAQGGMIAHVGVIIMLFGITGTAKKVEIEKTVQKGQKIAIEQYTVNFNDFHVFQKDRREMIIAEFDISLDNKKLKTVRTAKFFYMPTLEGMEEQTTTEMGIYSSPREDILFILLGYDVNRGIANIKIVKNPLIMWLWLGCTFLFIGTIIGLMKYRRNYENKS